MARMLISYSNPKLQDIDPRHWEACFVELRKSNLWPAELRVGKSIPSGYELRGYYAFPSFESLSTIVHLLLSKGFEETGSSLLQADDAQIDGQLYNKHLHNMLGDNSSDNNITLLAFQPSQITPLDVIPDASVETMSNEGEGISELCRLARDGDEEAIEQSLAVADFDEEECFSALCVAAENGHTGIVDLLRTRLDEHAFSGKTSLFQAAQTGKDLVVQLLLEMDPDLDAQDRLGKSLLAAAAENGHDRVVCLLLEKACAVDSAGRSGHSALYLAASNGHTSVVQTLLSAGADANKKGRFGESTVSAAAEKGHFNIVLLLLRHNADLNTADAQKRTILHHTIGFGELETTHYLLACGADPNHVDYLGRTPLHIATANGSESLVAAFFDNSRQKKCEIDSPGELGKTALHTASEYGMQNIVELLLQEGASIDSRDAKKRTALHLAAQGGHLAVIKTLVENGSDIVAKDNYDRTAVQEARRFGKEKACTFLQEHMKANQPTVP